jgi:DNA polymerase delta subunit 2
MIEDESGRLRLVGERVHSAGLVTGIIIGALGMETAGGDFEVVDICYAGIPPQAQSPLDVNEENAMKVDGMSLHFARSARTDLSFCRGRNPGIW